MLEVVYLDAADGFLVNGRSQTIREVWGTDYASASPLRDWAPYVRWCRVWKPVAVGVTAVTDAAKFMLIHPVRGPLTVAAAGVGITVITH